MEPEPAAAQLAQRPVAERLPAGPVEQELVALARAAPVAAVQVLVALALVVAARVPPAAAQLEPVRLAAAQARVAEQAVAAVAAGFSHRWPPWWACRWPGRWPRWHRSPVWRPRCSPTVRRC